MQRMVRLAHGLCLHAERRRRALQDDAQETEPKPPLPWTEEFAEMSLYIRGHIAVVRLAEEEDDWLAIAALAASQKAAALVVVPDGTRTPQILAHGKEVSCL